MVGRRTPAGTGNEMNRVRMIAADRDRELSEIAAKKREKLAAQERERLAAQERTEQEELIAGGAPEAPAEEVMVSEAE